ncbi:LOW QUALITY PROTEIN: hypothetical protein HID58_021114, partial [Brassica napus]
REREESIPNLDDGKASSKEEYDSSVNANTDATKKEKMRQKRYEKPWSSIVDSSVDLPYKPSSTVTSSKKTFDPVTFLENMSKSLACADLATAFLAVLGNEKASREIFNISGEKYVTFDGLARACAKAGGFPEPEIVHYNLKSSTLGRRRLSLSVTSISLPRWRKQSMFLDGNLDFGRGTFRKEADFTTDDMILSKKLVLL